MKKENMKEKKEVVRAVQEKKFDLLSYRLKCDKTANGLSHYLMYGDISEEKSLL